MKLLTRGESNTKLAKGAEKYLVYGLPFAHSKSSGYNVCEFASSGCIRICLEEHAGLNAANHDPIHDSHVRKTKYYFEHRAAFLRDLHRELRNACKLGERKGKQPVVRLNVYSDIVWEEEDPSLFQYPIQFYDYTKNPNRWGNPSNYHLTFSRSELNYRSCRSMLRRGRNVAVAFNSSFPDEYYGVPTINGDEDDNRFNDPWPRVVCLSAKSMIKAKRANNPFFVSVKELISG